MTSSTCFSTLGQLAKICTQLVDSPSSDQHGRGVLLPTYIHYFKIGAKGERWFILVRYDLTDWILIPLEMRWM